MKAFTKNFEFTSESVTEGHPDKLCDQISDAILDKYLAVDPNSHVACEVMATAYKIIVAGEISSTANFTQQEIKSVVKEVIKNVGYTSDEYHLNYDTVEIEVLLNVQSEEIKKAVDHKLEIKAGDQGIMFGYATDETKQFMPTPIMLAHNLVKQAAQCRKEKRLPYLGPDGKSQVTVRYENGKPIEVTNVILSLQHTKEALRNGKLRDDVKDQILQEIIQPVLSEYLTTNTKIFINPSGSFVVGGPQADTGLTGRKIMVDTYGGWVPHGGGAFSGKDPTKVDRSAAYMARYVAKNIVAAGLAKECLIQLAYSIGKKDPVSIFVNTFGTGKLPDEKLAKLIQRAFSFSVGNIIEKLNLTKAIYRHTACYGHFGRDDKDFPWEEIDCVEELIRNLAKI